MQKQVLVALAIISTLTAGYFLFKRESAKPEAVSNSLRDIYNQWKLTYRINVGASEDDYRFKVFSSNYAKITSHNRLLGRSYSLGLNSFTHLTHEEFAATKLGLKTPKSPRNVVALPVTNLKSSVDWSVQMNKVRNQGLCGSCWAFSAVGAIEGLHSVQKGNRYELSEQELVDCSRDFGNEGCNGGLMDSAFEYVVSVGGLATETDYPYTGIDSQCKNGFARLGKISGYTDVPENSSKDLKAALALQPVSVAIEADSLIFQGYSSGVINDVACGTELNHGVVAVGYNDDDRIPYYKVRNSWGDGWGEQGHVRIGIQEGKGICGIQMAASYPTL